MRAIPYGAEAVKRRDTARSGEVAVGTSADGTFIERQAHFRAQRFRTSEKRGAHFPFERSAVESAVNLEPRARKRGAQRA